MIPWSSTIVILVKFDSCKQQEISIWVVDIINGKRMIMMRKQGKRDLKPRGIGRDKSRNKKRKECLLLKKLTIRPVL